MEALITKVVVLTLVFVIGWVLGYIAGAYNNWKDKYNREKS